MFKAFGKSVRQGSVDYPLLIATAVLVSVGLVIVYDASVVQSFRDFGDNYFLIRQQVLWLFLGSFFLLIASLFPYQKLRKLASWMLGASIVLLLLVFVPGLGFGAGGAHRWLRIGPVSLQPAEIIKLTSVIWLAVMFEHGIKFKPAAILVSSVTFVIGILQKDLGSAIVYFLSCFSVYVVAGGRLKNIIYSIPVAVVAFLVFVFTSEYRKHRVLGFLDPFADPQGYTYHITQVLIALGAGGWFGVGVGQSRQKFEFIPEVATDSIFAIVGEEIGFIGASVVVVLMAFLIYRGLKVAERAKDRFGQLLAFGLVAWLGIQATVNFGAMVALIPLTGVPLPFISYGGSALVCDLIAVGILLNISRST